MLVVSNTSPLSNLAILNRLDILREQFGHLLVPTAVQRELSQLSNPEALARLHRVSRRVAEADSPGRSSFSPNLDGSASWRDRGNRLRLGAPGGSGIAG